MLEASLSVLIYHIGYLSPFYSANDHLVMNESRYIIYQTTQWNAVFDDYWFVN